MRRTNPEIPTANRKKDRPPIVRRSQRILVAVTLAFVLAGVTGIAGFMCVLVPQENARQIDNSLIASLQTANVGDSIFLGVYEQDNDPADGAEAIEWLILSKEGNRLLLVSRYALDCVPFNTDSRISTWDYSSILRWLNKSFFLTAFSPAEQTMIPLAEVEPDRNTMFDTDPGKTTRSHVFLLGLTEANALFRTADDRQCLPTAYAEAQGADVQDGGCGWWLRSPGYDVTAASRVLPDGGFSFIGQPAERRLAVRPAMWIEYNNNV